MRCRRMGTTGKERISLPQTTIGKIIEPAQLNLNFILCQTVTEIEIA